jgi:hypothetical protein
MYNNVPTEYALQVISEYLIENESEFHYYDAPILTRPLEIVMKNNMLEFGDHSKNI